jgi:hypothetical protein
MSTDKKIQYGMIGMTGASLLLMTMGIHVSPLAGVNGFGSG